MKLSLVIVHYNTSDDLGRCLESVRRHPPACELGIVVVDNASSDPGLEAVQGEHPDVHWIRNSGNVGFARAANIGMSALDAEYHLVMNPDIVVQPGSLDALLRFADAHPKAGVVGPQLLNEDGSIQDSCRRFYSFRTLLLRRTVIGKVWRGSGEIDRHLMRDFDHLAPRPVDWILGGCMLVRRRALERTGAMDERFFLYFEDVDFCYRMWQAGWDVFYCPEARFVHRHRRDSAGGPLRRSFWLHLGSLISFYEKWGMVVYLLKRWRDPLSTGLLWLLDMAALAAAFVGAYALRAALNPIFPEALFPLSEYRPLLGFALLLTSLTFLLLGRYRPGRLRETSGFGDRLRRTGAVSLLLLASTYLSHQRVYSRAVLLLFIPLFALAVSLGEGLFAALRRRIERGYLSLERSLFVGPAAAVRAWLADRPDLRAAGLDPVGYLANDAAPGTVAPAAGEVPCLGAESDLPAVVLRYRVAQVVFWGWPADEGPVRAVLARLRRGRIRLRWLAPEAGLFDAGARPEPFQQAHSVVLDPGQGSPPVALARRVAGLLAGAALAVVTLPVHALVRPLAGWGQRAQTLSGGIDDDGAWILRTVRRGDGRLLPLWCQFPMALALLAGRLNLWGPRVGVDSAEIGFAELSAAVPGLTGVWAGDRARDRLRGLFHDPAGLAAPVSAAAAATATPSPRQEDRR